MIYKLKNTKLLLILTTQKNLKILKLKNNNGSD